MTEPSTAAQDLFGTQLPAAQAYHDSLATVAVERGLIGPREVSRLWDRHLVNSALLGLLPQQVLPLGATVCDVGSGAGLPGIPLALSRPDLLLTLVEPLERRSDYLREVVQELGLANVTVVRGRADDAQVRALKPRFDVVTSRAVAPLDRLLQWCVPLTGMGRYIAAIKGKTVAAEIAALSPQTARRVRDVRAVECRLPNSDASLTVLLAQRAS